MDDDIDKCPICPSLGPPVRPTPSTSASVFGDELHWIACSKCSTWYHSVCTLQHSEDHASTVPQAVRDEIGEDVWAKWAAWVERWYCRACLDYSVSPENPKPPHHPLRATIKKSTFPPRRAEERAKSQGASPMDDAQEKGSAGSLSGSAPASASASASASARPKRKAAENAPDYWAWNHGIASPTANWLRLIAEPEKFGKDIRVGDFPRVKAEQLNKAWLDSGDAAALAFCGEGHERRPILVTKEDGGIEGLGGKVPGRELTVGDVAEQVGRNQAVDVIDVATQTSAQWNLGKWATYFAETTEPDWNGKVHNIISLEITGTPLAKKVRPPRIVREIDWVDNHWPFKGKEEDWDQEKIKPGVKYPKVQMYCLMGIRGSWTDWHVDFAASSVYYHIHTGAKEFYFIRPTEQNLKAYATWSGSAELQQREWLGDMCEGGVEKVRLLAGDTMFIPAGYIHAVYTPANSIVFGGNFIHSYSIPTQLRLRQIEIDTKVPQRFRFPFFDKLNWYVADAYCSQLRSLRAYRPKTPPHPAERPVDQVLRGLLQMADFLQSQVDILEDEKEEDKKRKGVYERVPGEVKDPAGLVRELVWRVTRELGAVQAQGQGQGQRMNGGAGSAAPGPQPATGQMAPPSATSMSMAMSMSIPAPSKRRKLAQKAIPPSRRTSTIAWSVTEEPQSSSVESVSVSRGGADAVAEKRVERWKQTRQRQYEVDGKLVLEEQVVEFSESRTIVP